MSPIWSPKCLVFAAAVSLLVAPSVLQADARFFHNGHTYDLVTTTRSWVAAAADAASRSVNGQPGFLARIEDPTEDVTLFSNAAANIPPDDFNLTRAADGGSGAYLWIGATDRGQEGRWIWDGDNDGDGDQFWQGTQNGNSVGGLYQHWGHLGGGLNEPDDFQANQDGRALSLDRWPLGIAGQWNDVDESNELYYIIEYAALPPNVAFFPLIGDGVSGTIGFLTELFFVNTGGPTNLLVEFLNPQGGPLNLNVSVAGIQTAGPSSTFSRDLDAGEGVAIATAGTDALQVGYARVTSSPEVGGTAVFGRSQLPGGTGLYEAGVGAGAILSDFSLFLDSLENKDTGLALVFPGDTSGTSTAGNGQTSVTLRLYATDFQLLGTAVFLMNPREQVSRFIWEFFKDQPAIMTQAQEIQAIVTVESDQPLAALTLRQNDDPSQEFPGEVPRLSSLPIIPGRADASMLAAVAVGRQVGKSKP